MGKYQSVRWGKLKTFQVPRFLLNNQTFSLSGKAIAVYLAFLQTARTRGKGIPEQFVVAKIGHASLMTTAGISKNIVTRAVKELEVKRFVRTDRMLRKKHKEFGVNEYFIWNPATDEPLMVPAGKKWSFYRANITYFTMPKEVITEALEKWSLAQMSSSEISLYIAALWLANEHRQNEFLFDQSSLRKLAGISTPKTFKKALDSLQDKGLVSVSDEVIALCDPFTGDPLPEPGQPESDPANYVVTGQDDVVRRLRSNWTPEQVERILMSSLPKGAEWQQQSNGDVKIICPFHAETQPSCSVSLQKRCFQCFGCKKKGNFTDLVIKLLGISRPEAIRHCAAAVGQSADLKEPDSKAEAVHRYRNRSGKVMKEVLRFRDPVTGEKHFSQRRPVKGGYIPNATGVESYLYRLDELQHASTTCITEGEGDADMIHYLNLFDVEGKHIVGTTTGGANTWKDHHADEFVGKRVIVMPDDDEAGRRYEEQIVDSLQRRGIEFRIVRFGDVAAKDVTEFLKNHSVSELMERIGAEWVLRTDVQPESRAEPPVLAY